jgi:hypothetical protein
MPLIFRKIGAGRDSHEPNRGFRGWARIRDEFIRAIRAAIHQNLLTLRKFPARIIHREVRQEREGRRKVS